MSLLRLRPVLRSLPAQAQPLNAARFASTISVTSTRSNASAPVLANIEAAWKDLPAEEQFEVYQQLEELQKKDWKELTIDEKKAAYFVAFGPHGPRAPVTVPGQQGKVLVGTLLSCLAAFGIFTYARSKAAPPPKTMTREYQEATNEYLKSQNINPITGISSEGYKGKGMTTLP